MRELAKKPDWHALLISGDEPFLSLELLDQTRQFLRKQGFEERELFEVDGRFDWSQFSAATETLSLFSTLKIIELRFKNLPDRKAHQAIMEYLSAPSSDLFIIIETPQIKSSGLNAKWVKAVEKVGAVIPVYPPRFHEYPRWIAGRAAQKGLRLSPEAVTLLAEHNEGNLFSVAQELDYLALFYGEEEVDVEGLRRALTQSSRFIAFDLSDAMLMGDVDRVFRIIEGLEAEGEPATLVNWMLQREVSLLGQMLNKRAKGAPMNEVFAGIWQSKRPLYQSALSRIDERLWRNLTRMIVQIDHAIKGQLQENPWNAIRRVAFALAGQRLLSLSAKV